MIEHKQDIIFLELMNFIPISILYYIILLIWLVQIYTYSIMFLNIFFSLRSNVLPEKIIQFGMKGLMMRTTNFRPRSIQHDIGFSKTFETWKFYIIFKKSIFVIMIPSIIQYIFLIYINLFLCPYKKNLKSGSFSIHHLMICQNKKSNSVENAYVTKIYLDFIGFTMEGELWKWTNYWNGT